MIGHRLHNYWNPYSSLHKASTSITLKILINILVIHNRRTIIPQISNICIIWKFVINTNSSPNPYRRLLKVPWNASRLNQLSLKDINPAYSLEELMLKLNLQYFGHLMGRADSLEKTLMLGKIEGRRRRGRQRIRWLDGITDSVDMSLSKHLGHSERQGSLACCSPQHRKASHMTELLNSEKQSPSQDSLNQKVQV